MTAPRVLTLDIETSPHLADVWALWDQNVSLTQLREASRVICFGAKWHHSDEVMFYSEHHQDHRTMVERAFALLDEADIVVHFNGRKFDIPHLNREIDGYRLGVPAPYKQVDLLQVAKKHFRFASNKLAHITAELGLSGKLDHSGHELWVRCLAGDPAAWAEMTAYCCQDVRTTEELYDRWLPWIDTHPTVTLLDDSIEPRCGKCGSNRLQRRGVATTKQGLFQRFQCQGCGGWSRGTRKLNSVGLVGVSL